MVATSEFVVSLGGPATDVGTLATTFLPLSKVNMKTRLYPPSFFSYESTLDAPGYIFATVSHKREKLNFNERDWRCSSS